MVSLKTFGIMKEAFDPQEENLMLLFHNVFKTNQTSNLLDIADRHSDLKI